MENSLWNELNFRQLMMNVCSLQMMDVHTNTGRTSLKENAAHNECRCHALLMGNRTEHLNRIFVKKHNSQGKKLNLTFLWIWASTHYYYRPPESCKWLCVSANLLCLEKINSLFMINDHASAISHKHWCEAALEKQGGDSHVSGCTRFNCRVMLI